MLDPALLVTPESVPAKAASRSAEPKYALSELETPSPMPLPAATVTWPLPGRAALFANVSTDPVPLMSVPPE